MSLFACFQRPSLTLIAVWLLVAGGLTQSPLSLAQYGNFGENGFEDSPYLGFRPLDHAFVDRALERINRISSRRYGSSLKQVAAHDLPLLQRIIDDELIERDDLETAQAMGVALGALLATELNLDWIRYRDQDGISRALRVRHSDQVFFPVSMISRRYRVGLNPSVHILYGTIENETRRARSIYAED